MKYQTTKDFINAAILGDFKGKVVIDNDNVTAREDGEVVCNFGGGGPEVALSYVLDALRIKNEWA